MILERLARHDPRLYQIGALASLTGWRIEDVRQKMGLAMSPAANRKWYEKLWDR